MVGAFVTAFAILLPEHRCENLCPRTICRDNHPYHTRLRAFEFAHRLAVLVYQRTRQFPHDECFGLVAQMRLRGSIHCLEYRGRIGSALRSRLHAIPRHGVRFGSRT